MKRVVFGRGAAATARAVRYSAIRGSVGGKGRLLGVAARPVGVSGCWSRPRPLSTRAAYAAAAAAAQHAEQQSQESAITDLHVQEAVESEPLLEHLGVAPLRMVRQNVTGKGRYYTSASHGESFPSVTSVLDVLDKGPALQRWQIRQVLASVKEEVLSPGFEPSPRAVAGVVKRCEGAPARVMNVAADKGTSFHNIVEAIVRDGCLPPGGVPAHLASGVDAFLRWSRSSGLVFESSGEVVVASHRYGYAGSMDALARCSRTGALVALDWKSEFRGGVGGVMGGGWGGGGKGRRGEAQRTGKKARGCRERSTKQNNLTLRWEIDATASSGIYNNHGMQVCAYAHALNEMMAGASGASDGSSPTQRQVTSARVVRFNCASGEFEEREVKDFDGAFKVFLAALFVFRNGKQKLI